jgi:hypothetical protein
MTMHGVLRPPLNMTGTTQRSLPPGGPNFGIALQSSGEGNALRNGYDDTSLSPPLIFHDETSVRLTPYYCDVTLSMSGLYNVCFVSWVIHTSLYIVV